MHGLAETPLASANGDEEIVSRAVLVARLRGHGDWHLREDEMWCHVQPAASAVPAQGWKLHLTATPLSAAEVLERALPVLLRERCTFKFVRTVGNVRSTTAGNYPREAAGKFLTVYPRDDAELRRLAPALHEATQGLPGPAILSDHAYTRDSLVYLRYGAFRQRRILTVDGELQHVIEAPDGRLEYDRREPRFSPPAWAAYPFPVYARGGSAAGPPVVGERFEVELALRRATKGGVYIAVDRETGDRVVLKEARAHVGVTASGRDARDRLHTERVLLDRLAPLGLAPRAITELDAGDRRFLAQEFLPGVPLRRWVHDRFAERPAGLPESLALRAAGRLAELVARVHAEGVVLRDLTPGNVLVRPDGELRLVDFELAAHPAVDHDALAGLGTPAYAAPEQLAGAPPHPAADAFGLGATLWFLVTGADPYLPEDSPPLRSTRERLAERMAAATQTCTVPEALRRLIPELMDEAPARRPTAALVARRLRQRVARPPAANPLPALTEQQRDAAIAGIVEHLLATVAPGDEEHLFEPSRAGRAADPCAVHYGAAGVLGVLGRAFELTGDPRLREALVDGCRWVLARLPDYERPPGLYFGLAGIAWTLHDVGALLGDPTLVTRGLEIARALPSEWPNPDLAHGMAGIGMTKLHLAARSGDATLLTGALLTADALARTAIETRDGVMWQVPPGFPSLMAGQRCYGFAHGNAGIGAFLLAAADAGRPAAALLAQNAALTLRAAASVQGAAATWAVGPGARSTRWAHWCNGSSGIGTFLLRLHAVTGDAWIPELVEQAACAVVEQAPRSATGACHGLAGDAEFLLDCALWWHSERDRERAERLAGLIFSRRLYRDGRIVFSDEPAPRVPADWSVGLAGILAFLLRLRALGPRLWMVEPAQWPSASLPASP